VIGDAIQSWGALEPAILAALQMPLSLTKHIKSNETQQKSGSLLETWGNALLAAPSLSGTPFQNIMLVSAGLLQDTTNITPSQVPFSTTNIMGKAKTFLLQVFVLAQSLVSN
jgi:hypothetical protein